MKYDELVKWLNRIRSPYAGECANAIITLQAELEQCRKDAERYRWLCNTKQCIEQAMLYVAFDANDKYELDDAIDKAMESV